MGGIGRRLHSVRASASLSHGEGALGAAGREKLILGEDPMATAVRELEEETGFRAESVQHVLSFYPAPGFCDELLHLYYTHRLRSTEKNPDPDEEITVEFHTLEEAIQLGLRGEIIDAKDAIGSLLARLEKKDGERMKNFE